MGRVPNGRVEGSVHYPCTRKRTDGVCYMGGGGGGRRWGGDRLRSPKVCPLRLRGDLTNLFGGFSLCDPWRAPCQQTGMGDPHHPDGMPLELP